MEPATTLATTAGQRPAQPSPARSWARRARRWRSVGSTRSPLNQAQAQRPDIAGRLGRGTEATLEARQRSPVGDRPPAAGKGPLQLGEQGVCVERRAPGSRR